jgi:hypothetical protein
MASKATLWRGRLAATAFAVAITTTTAPALALEGVPVGPDPVAVERASRRPGSDRGASGSLER